MKNITVISKPFCHTDKYSEFDIKRCSINMFIDSVSIHFGIRGDFAEDSPKIKTLNSFTEQVGGLIMERRKHRRFHTSIKPYWNNKDDYIFKIGWEDNLEIINPVISVYYFNEDEDEDEDEKFE